MTATTYNWVNVWERAKRSRCAFNFFFGARGTGKTYGGLLHQHEDFFAEECGKYIYMRLTQTELDICASESDNPYKKHNARYNWDVHFNPVPKAKHYEIVDHNFDDTVIGNARALATFGNVRGSDFSDCTHIIFDEFAPAERVRKTPEIKNAGYLFSQAYETINRNRELEGEPPVTAILLANSFRLDSDILMYYKLIPIIENMQRTGQKRCTIPERSIYIELCDAVDISEAKRDTVLYKALQGNKQIESVNLNNTFNDYKLTLVNSRVKLVEYYPLVMYDNIVIYQHKGSGMLYACVHPNVTCTETYSYAERSKFVVKWRAFLKAAFLERTIRGENADVLYALDDILNNPNL